MNELKSTLPVKAPVICAITCLSIDQNCSYSFSFLHTVVFHNSFVHCLYLSCSCDVWDLRRLERIIWKVYVNFADFGAFLNVSLARRMNCKLMHRTSKRRQGNKKLSSGATPKIGECSWVRWFGVWAGDVEPCFVREFVYFFSKHSGGKSY